MKHANQINLFLAITGCIAVLWVFSQTYLSPSPFENLEITEIAGGAASPISTQTPAAYQTEGTTNTKAAVYGNTPETRRPPSEGMVGGGGSLRTGGSPSGSAASASSGLNSATRAIQSGNRGQAVVSGSEGLPASTADTVAGTLNDSGTAGAASANGFSAPPAGQALGMEQAKRTPADSSSQRKYVPFRSSMANRPN